VNSPYSAFNQVFVYLYNDNKAVRLRISVVRTISILLALITAQPTHGFASAPQNTDRSALMTIAQGLKGSCELRYGLPVEREIKPNEIHSYQVHPKVGDFFRVVVMQNGIDDPVTLIAPDGKEIVVVDSPNSRHGPEPVSAIAELAGGYQLDVKALDEASSPGRYEIILQELRPPGALDRNRITAERMLVEAEHLHAKSTSESWPPLLEMCGTGGEKGRARRPALTGPTFNYTLC
jgi:hypothetical protein